MVIYRCSNCNPDGSPCFLEMDSEPVFEPIVCPFGDSESKWSKKIDQDIIKEEAK